jgi:hypothetical protein
VLAPRQSFFACVVFFQYTGFPELPSEPQSGVTPTWMPQGTPA